MTCGDVRHGQPRPVRRLIEIVDGGQAAGEEFAEDHPLGQAVDAAEIELLRQRLQRFAHQPLVARIDRRQPIAQHDPIGEIMIVLALAAHLFHHPGVAAGAGDMEGLGLDGGEHVEIDKTVVERRHQRVRNRMGRASERALVAGRVDDDEVACLRQRDRPRRRAPGAAPISSCAASSRHDMIRESRDRGRCARPRRAGSRYSA